MLGTPSPSGGRGRRTGGGRDQPGAGRGSRRVGPSSATQEPDADPEQVARQICLHQLEHAPRTRAELAAVLSRRGVPDDVAERVLGRFAEVGMIDDALFAQMWVTSRHRGRGLARTALRAELRRKGVDEEHVDAAVGELDPQAERETAVALVARRLPATRGLEPQARVRRLAGLLARKGYPAGLAFAVVKDALAAEGEEVDVPEPD